MATKLEDEMNETQMTTTELSPRDTYDAFAGSYDDFNHRYKYERWTGRLLGAAEGAGLRGHRLLDVGCGTGLSFVSLLDRGWQVTGCDISPAMLDLARERASGRAELVVADMRALPALGEFDLVWAVNDAMNYLLTVEEFEAALAGMAGNLAPGGVVVFDVNTLTTYRTFFSTEFAVERGGRRFVWSGQMSPENVAPGCYCEARYGGEGDGVEAHVHRQRHFGEPVVRGALEAAGLRCVTVAGEREGELEPGLDEDSHTKAVYVAVAA